MDPGQIKIIFKMVRVVLLFLLFLSTVLCSIFTDAIGGTVDDALIEKKFLNLAYLPKILIRTKVFSPTLLPFSVRIPVNHLQLITLDLLKAFTITWTGLVSQQSLSFNRKNLTSNQDS